MGGCGRSAQGGSMSSNPNTPVEVTHVTEAGLPRWVTLLFVVAFALVGYLLYAGYAERQNFHKGLDDADRKFQALAAEVDKTNSRLADLKGQLEVTSQKLGLTQDELARARSLAQSIKKEQTKRRAAERTNRRGPGRHYDEVRPGGHRTQRDQERCGCNQGRPRNHEDQAAEPHRRLGCAERPDR